MVSPITKPGGQVVMPPPPLQPEDAFKKIDSSNKGYITESDLASAIVQFSPEGMSLSQADAQAVAKDAFSKMDANADGKVTLGEVKDAAPKHSPNGGPPGGRPSGPPPGPPPGSGGGPTAGRASTASSSSRTDPADTNQDGTVSDAERLAYASKQQSSATAASSQTNNTETR